MEVKPIAPAQTYAIDPSGGTRDQRERREANDHAPRENRNALRPPTQSEPAEGASPSPEMDASLSPLSQMVDSEKVLELLAQRSQLPNPSHLVKKLSPPKPALPFVDVKKLDRSL